MAKVYKEMGIKNYNFLLRLDNPALLYVDPHDPNLDLPTQLAVLEEVRNNRWYFLRECIRIPTGGGLGMFIAHRGNIAISWCHDLNLNTLIMLPRQTNKTTTVLANYVYDFYFGSINTEFALYGLKEKFLKDNMDKFRNLRDALPSYMQLKSSLDRENVSEIRFNLGPGKYNLINYVVSATSEDKAKSVSRGSTKPRMMKDEFAFSPFIRIEHANSVYAFLEVARTAKKNNSSYGITMLTTAGYLNEDCGRWAFNKFADAAPFDEMLYDKVYEAPNGKIKPDRKAILDYLINNSREKDGIPNTEFSSFMKVVFQWYEMGYTQEWLNNMRAASDTEDDFRREVLEEWQDATTNHPYGQERIRELQTKRIRPVESIVVNNLYILKLYRRMTDRDWKLPLICGMDSGSNIGNDFSTLVFLDPSNFEVVAVMRSNQYSAVKFGKAVSYILENIFPNSILVPERNSLGSVVIQIITESMKFDPGRRVYRDKSEVLFSGTSKIPPYGVHLTQQLRDIFFNDILRRAIISEMDKIHDEDIINEITGLRFTKANRVDHQDGGHDDTLFAYLYTRWFLQYAPNRNKYIDPIIIGSRMFTINDDDYKEEENMSKGFSNTESSIRDLNDVMGKDFTSRYQRKTPAEIQKEMHDRINKDVRENTYTDEEYDRMSEGEYRSDIFIDRMYDKYQKSKENEYDNTSEYRTKVDLESTYGKDILEVEPEKLSEDIKEKIKAEEMTEEAMRNAFNFIFNKTID